MIPRDVIRKIRHIEIRTRRAVNDVFAGQYHSVFKGQGMEFQEVREYVPGDDIRAIDWNVTARTGHPYVKEFVEERELTVMLLADVSASNRFGSAAQLKKDLVAEMTAVLAFSAVRNNDRAGLILFTDEVECHVPPRKGASHVLRVIREALYHRPRRAGTRLSPALDYLHHVCPRRAVAFLISDFLCAEDYERPLAVAARRHDLVAIVVGDRREQSWPRAGLVRWQDAETGRTVLADTSDSATRRALTARQAARRAERNALFRRHGIDAVEVATGAPYEKELIKFFRARERRLRV
jgi:uncharacterized protein (DUF58 family)